MFCDDPSIMAISSDWILIWSWSNLPYKKVHQHVKMGVLVSFSVPKQEHHPLWSVSFLETVFGVGAHASGSDTLGISVEKL